MSNIRIEYSDSSGARLVVHRGVWLSRSGAWLFVHREKTGDQIVFAIKASKVYSIEFEE